MSSAPSEPELVVNRSRIPRDVWALGAVSLLTDMSSELVHSLLPVYLVSTLGASLLVVGTLDGAAEFVALVVKTFSGRLSDLTGKRKPLVLLGYGLSAFTKLLFPLANSIGLVVGARLLDRTGKGIRGAPRDALISEITPPELRGAAFGLRQSLDTVGAVAGPLLAIAGMLLFASDIRTVLWIAVIPGALGVLVLALFVREPTPVARHVAPVAAQSIARSTAHGSAHGSTHGSAHGTAHNSAHNTAGSNAHSAAPGLFSALRTLGPAYWRLVTLAMLLMFARGTEAFLLLRATSVGLADTWAPLSLVLMSLTYAMTSWPAGRLSDRVPRERVLTLGIILLAVSHVILSVATDVAWVLLGTALWGVHMGFTQGTVSAMLADRSPPAMRGTAFGVYATASGIALLMSGAAGGALWQTVSPAATFAMGAIAAVMSLVFLRTMK